MDPEKPKTLENLIYKDEAYAVVGAAMEVHSQLGFGFLESVYQEAMEIELKARQIPFESQKRLDILYKGTCLNKAFVADLVVYGKIIVELKANSTANDTYDVQIINYLKATGLQLGLLINFGAPRLIWKRIIWTPRISFPS